MSDPLKAGMFLKCGERREDGKVHRSWSVVESHRYASGQIAQRHVLYLREINDSQRLARELRPAACDEPSSETHQLAFFPADGTPAVHVRLDALRITRLRQRGACWLADHLWRTVHLDDLFSARLPVSRKDTDWEKVLRVLVIYRLLAPGSDGGCTVTGSPLQPCPTCSASTPEPCRMTPSTPVTTCSCRTKRNSLPPCASIHRLAVVKYRANWHRKDRGITHRVFTKVGTY